MATRMDDVNAAIHYHLDQIRRWASAPGCRRTDPQLARQREMLRRLIRVRRIARRGGMI